MRNPLSIRIPQLICPFEHADSQDEILFMFSNYKSVIAHLKEYHNIQISDPCTVHLFIHEYLEFYAKFNSQLCDTILSNDSHIRETIQKQKLQTVLRLQDIERKESREFWSCLFCKHIYDSRAYLLNHMFVDHSFHIGRPDNLIFVPELFQLVSERMSGLQCIYCEKVFKDMPTLRRHMRKKKHLRLNPSNRDYDRFYLVNYLEPGKTWTEIEKDDGSETGDEDGDEEGEEGWSDWSSDDCELKTSCLFCGHVDSLPDTIVHEHMPSIHGFNIEQLSVDHGLDLYDKIKLVNYIRRMHSLETCFICEQVFDSSDLLVEHLHASSHSKRVPPKEHAVWKDPQYLYTCF